MWGLPLPTSPAAKRTSTTMTRAPRARWRRARCDDAIRTPVFSKSVWDCTVVQPAVPGAPQRLCVCCPARVERKRARCPWDQREPAPDSGGLVASDGRGQWFLFDQGQQGGRDETQRGEHQEQGDESVIVRVDDDLAERIGQSVHQLGGEGR